LNGASGRRARRIVIEIDGTILAKSPLGVLILSINLVEQRDKKSYT